MLNASELKTQMIQAFNNPENSEQAHIRVSGAIKEYLIANASVPGIYIGVLASGSPDPLGTAPGTSYNWTFDNMEGMDGDIGNNLGNDPLAGWTDNVKTALSTMKCKQKDAVAAITLTSPPTIIINSLDFGDMSSIADYEEAINIIASKIIESVQTATILTAPATSTASGTGNVVFGGIT